MKRFLKIASIVLGSLFIIVVGTLVGIYFALRSPDFTAKITPKIQKIAQDSAGVKLEIGSVAVDLFRHLLLRKVTTHVVKDTITANVNLENVEVHYGLWDLLWHRKLVVSTVLIDGMHVDVAVDGLPQAAETQKPEPEKAAAGNPLELLEHPPATFNLESFAIKGMSVNVAFTDRGKKVQARIDPFDLDSSVILVPGKLSLQYGMSLQNAKAHPITVAITDDTAHSQLDLSLLVRVTSKGSLSIESNVMDWKFLLDKLENSIAVNDITVRLKDPLQSVAVNLGAFTVTSEVTASSERMGTSERVLDKLLFPMKVTAKKHVELHDIQVKRATSTKEQMDVTLSALTHDATAELEIASLDDLLATLIARAEGAIKLNGLAVAIQKGETKQNIGLVQQTLQFKVDLQKAQLGLNAELALTKLSTAPLQAPIDLHLTLVNKLDNLIETMKRSGAIKTDVSLVVSNISVPQLASPLELATDLQFNSTLQNKVYNVSGRVKLNRFEALRYNLSLADMPKMLNLEGNVILKAAPELESLVAQLKELKKVGSLSLANDIKVSVAHPWDSVEKMAGDIPSAISADVDLKTAIAQQSPATDPDLGVLIGKPIYLQNQIQWSKKSARLVFSGELPHVGVRQRVVLPLPPKKGGVPQPAPQSVVQTSYVNNVKIQVNAAAKSGLEPKDGDVKVSVTFDSVSADALKDHKDVLHMADNFAFAMNAALQNGRSVVIKEFKLGSGKDAFTMSLDGTGDAKAQSGQSNGRLAFDLHKLPSLKELGDKKGILGVLWDLTVQNGNRAALDGVMTLQQINIVRDDLQIIGANGNMTLYEEIGLTKDKGIEFTYLIEEDPFLRVDYNRLSPYLQHKNELEIKKIQVKDLSVGPLLATVAVEQNMIVVPNFELALFGGNLAGQFFMNLHPKSMRIGLKGMLTHFDPSQLITKGKAAKLKDKYKGTLSASTALEIDLNKSLIEGRINVTEISGDQLIQLINVIDPDYEDERLAPIRSALNLGYPEYVEINMKYGLMDMRVDVKGLGVSTTQHVHGIELSRFVTAYTEPLKKSLAKIPIR